MSILPNPLAVSKTLRHERILLFLIDLRVLHGKEKMSCALPPRQQIVLKVGMRNAQVKTCGYNPARTATIEHIPDPAGLDLSS